jgi:hypothetical protein
MVKAKGEDGLDESEFISNDELKVLRAFRRKHDWLVADGGSFATCGKVVKKRMRVAQHKRIAEMLTPEQELAFILINRAFGMVTAGLGMQTFNPFRTPGGGGDIDRGAVLMASYWEWAQRVIRLRLSHAQALAVIVQGYGLREADRMFNCRNGGSGDNLTRCLDEFGLIWRARHKLYRERLHRAQLYRDMMKEKVDA